MFVWGVAQEVHLSLSGMDILGYSGIYLPIYLLPSEIEAFIWAFAAPTNELVCLFTRKFRQR